MNRNQNSNKHTKQEKDASNRNNTSDRKDAPKQSHRRKEQTIQRPIVGFRGIKPRKRLHRYRHKSTGHLRFKQRAATEISRSHQSLVQEGNSQGNGKRTGQEMGNILGGDFFENARRILTPEVLWVHHLGGNRNITGKPKQPDAAPPALDEPEHTTVEDYSSFLATGSVWCSAAETSGSNTSLDEDVLTSENTITPEEGRSSLDVNESFIDNKVDEFCTEDSPTGSGVHLLSRRHQLKVCQVEITVSEKLIEKERRATLLTNESSNYILEIDSRKSYKSKTKYQETFSFPHISKSMLDWEKSRPIRKRKNFEARQDVSRESSLDARVGRRLSHNRLRAPKLRAQLLKYTAEDDKENSAVPYEEINRDCSMEATSVALCESLKGSRRKCTEDKATNAHDNLQPEKCCTDSKQICQERNTLHARNVYGKSFGMQNLCSLENIDPFDRVKRAKAKGGELKATEEEQPKRKFNDTTIYQKPPTGLPVSSKVFKKGKQCVTNIVLDRVSRRCVNSAGVNHAINTEKNDYIDQTVLEAKECLRLTRTRLPKLPTKPSASKLLPTQKEIELLQIKKAAIIPRDTLIEQSDGLRFSAQAVAPSSVCFNETDCNPGLNHATLRVSNTVQKEGSDNKIEAMHSEEMNTKYENEIRQTKKQIKINVSNSKSTKLQTERKIRESFHEISLTTSSFLENQINVTQNHCETRLENEATKQNHSISEHEHFTSHVKLSENQTSQKSSNQLSSSFKNDTVSGVPYYHETSVVYQHDGVCGQSKSLDDLESTSTFQRIPNSELLILKDLPLTLNHPQAAAIENAADEDIGSPSKISQPQFTRKRDIFAYFCSRFSKRVFRSRESCVDRDNFGENNTSSPKIQLSPSDERPSGDNTFNKQGDDLGLQTSNESPEKLCKKEEPLGMGGIPSSDMRACNETSSGGNSSKFNSGTSYARTPRRGTPFLPEIYSPECMKEIETSVGTFFNSGNPSKDGRYSKSPNNSKLFPAISPKYSKLSPDKSPNYSKLSPDKSINYSSYYPDKSINYSRCYPDKSPDYSNLSPDKAINYSRCYPHRSRNYSKLFPDKSPHYSNISPDKSINYCRCYPEKSPNYSKLFPDKSSGGAISCPDVQGTRKKHSGPDTRLKSDYEDKKLLSFPDMRRRTMNGSGTQVENPETVPFANTNKSAGKTTFGNKLSLPPLYKHSTPTSSRKTCHRVDRQHNNTKFECSPSVGRQETYTLYTTSANPGCGAQSNQRRSPRNTFNCTLNNERDSKMASTYSWGSTRRSACNGCYKNASPTFRPLQEDRTRCLCGAANQLKKPKNKFNDVASITKPPGTSLGRQPCFDLLPKYNEGNAFGYSMKRLAKIASGNKWDSNNCTVFSSSLSCGCRNTAKHQGPPLRLLASSHYHPSSNLIHIVVKPINVTLDADNLDVMVKIYRNPGVLPPASKTKKQNTKTLAKTKMPRNIIDTRAANPPFNTSITDEADERYKRIMAHWKIL